jgi:hypothetical protein
MTTLNTENQESTPATAPASEPKATKKANVAPRKPRVAPSKGKSEKKATPPKKAAKAPKKATSAKTKGVARQGSKTEKVLELLKRSGGATLKEIMKATDWQPHSVRGFISGTLGKKMKLEVKSAKGEDGERTYSIAR